MQEKLHSDFVSVQLEEKYGKFEFYVNVIP